MRLRATDSSISCLNLEDAIEEFVNHHKRHQILKQKVIIPVSFAATTNSGEQPDNTIEYVCGIKHLFKNCYYINPNLRLVNWKGKDLKFQKVNRQFSNPRRVNLKSLAAQ